MVDFTTLHPFDFNRNLFNFLIPEPITFLVFVAVVSAGQQHPNSRPSGAKPAEHDAKHIDVKDTDTSTVPSGSTEQPNDSSVVEDPCSLLDISAVEAGN